VIAAATREETPRVHSPPAVAGARIEVHECRRDLIPTLAGQFTKQRDALIAFVMKGHLSIKPWRKSIDQPLRSPRSSPHSKTIAIPLVSAMPSQIQPWRSLRANFDHPPRHPLSTDGWRADFTMRDPACSLSSAPRFRVARCPARADRNPMDNARPLPAAALSTPETPSSDQRRPAPETDASSLIRRRA
jgi:hypothetical protein